MTIDLTEEQAKLLEEIGSTIEASTQKIVDKHINAVRQRMTKQQLYKGWIVGQIMIASGGLTPPKEAEAVANAILEKFKLSRRKDPNE